MPCNPEHPCRCRPSTLDRREFIKLAAFGAAAAFMPAGAMAGPFEASDFEKMIPADKKLSPEWVRSLTARGARTPYRGAELEKIGMPVGGLCAGQLYLGGDGKLWHWDIFNQPIGTGDAGYAHPPLPASPIEQGFALRIRMGDKMELRPLDRSGFKNITFRGEYPIGYVEYSDPDCPVTVSLEAFSPFIPLNVDDSSLPATVLRYTLRNTGKQAVEAELAGWLENGACRYAGLGAGGARRNRVEKRAGYLGLLCAAVPPAPEPLGNVRPDVTFENFQKETYEGWEATGTAFGKGPVRRADVPDYQGDLGAPRDRVLNTHAGAPGNTVEERDSRTGTLTSRPFTIERKYINFWVGGGNHPDRTCMNLLVDGKVVRTVTGHNSNRMRQDRFAVGDLQGKTARLQVVDQETGAWGHIGIAEIVFSDKPNEPAIAFEKLPDYGTMALALLRPTADDHGQAALGGRLAPEGAFPDTTAGPQAEAGMAEHLIGSLARAVKLGAGKSAVADFVLAWHFPNDPLKDGGRFYANRFAAAPEVADYVAAQFDRLARETRLWHDTWYDSTLPYWFLDRTFANTSTLATSTSHRFLNGRFYGWEGVGCCEGTCTHVWHYAHSVARIFPELERDARKRTDFGTAIDPRTGIINHRGEGAGLAVDGQAGCILRAYREHQMSRDAAFLRSIWPNVKLAMECLMRMDDGRGMLEGSQHNTLDQPWFGRVAWLSSLYVTAARACEVMATELGDQEFAARSRQVFEKGSANIDKELFNGEYYIHQPDPTNPKTVGSYNGCEIDQVFGQSWAFQVALGRVLPKEHTLSALKALWRYNFTPDVGPFREKNRPGRWYAMPGEAGLIMCTWPRGDEARVQTGFDFYFNECMNGFEHQVAGHMIWEGMLEQGLAIERALHDRYHAARRNPWNEVECGDHYARSMASYGVFLAACGYEHHGPQGHLGFAPRLSPESFRAAFTTAGGWGTYAQKRTVKGMTATALVKYGSLSLRSLSLALPDGATAASITVKAAGRSVTVTHTQEAARLRIAFAQPLELRTGQKLDVAVSTHA